MANIEKIVLEEIEKVRPKLENEENVYFHGTSRFDEFLKDVVLWAYRDDSEKYMSNTRMIYKNIIKKSVLRITMFFADGILIKSILIPSSSKSNLIPYMAGYNLFRKKYERHEENKKIDNVFIPFVDIVEYSVSDLEKTPNFVFKLKNQKNDFCIPVYELFNTSDNTLLPVIFPLFTNIYTNILSQDMDIKQLVNELENPELNDLHDKKVEICNKILEIFPDDFLIQTLKANSLNEINKFEEALRCLKSSLHLFYLENGDDINKWNTDVKKWYANAKYIESRIYENLQIQEQALWSCQEALNIDCLDLNTRESIKEKRDVIYTKYLNEFVKIEYSSRKVIFIDSELPSSKPNHVVPLRRANLNCLTFPPSHPVVGHLYVGHPFREELYFPLEDYENHLFKSQVMELSWLLQCLGAEKIKTEHIVGSSIFTSQDDKRTQDTMNNSSVSSDLGVGINKIQNDTNVGKAQKINTEQNSQTSNEVAKRINIDRTLKPIYKPYIPNDLIWYEHNEIWQSIAKQRLEGGGGRESQDIQLSTKDVEVVTDSERKNIEKEFELLVKAKGSNKIVKLQTEVNKSQHTNETSETTTNLKKNGTTEIRIYFEFAPIEELTVDPPSLDLKEPKSQPETVEIPEFNGIEDDYIEFFKDTVEDGIIEDSSRKILERRRVKLGISEDRAHELENLVLGRSDHTQEEKSYIEEVEFCLEDGNELGEAERKILNRKREKLNISVERAQELEKIILKK